MLHNVKIEWEDEMVFKNTADGHEFIVDAEREFGGQDKGPRPKLLLLSALAGCTAMDVKSMLKKMKQNVSWFAVKVEADLSSEHPKVYTQIRVTYQLKKSDGPDDTRVRKAARLSQEQYCGVSAMLQKACPVHWDVEYLD